MSDPLTHARAPWFATPVVAVAVLLGFEGLTTMVTWGPWLATAITLIAAPAAAVTLTRALSRSRLLPTIVGVVVSILASVPVFARGATGQVRYLPTPTALREWASVVGEGIHVAATTVAPAEMTRPLLALLMCSACAIFLVAEHLAVSLRAAALSGLVLLGPWMPAIALQHRVSVRVLLAAIGCWIMLLALTKRPTGIASRPSLVATVTATGAAVALVALVTPTALGGPGWGMIPRMTTENQAATTSRLNLELDLRNSLTDNPSTAVLVYVSTGARPEVLRLYTLERFDGRQWSLDESDGSTAPIEGVLWSTPVTAWEAQPLDRVVVSIQDFVSDHLPLPTVPRTVTVPGSWGYSPTHDVVSGNTATTQWLDYSFEADLTYFEAASLGSLGAASGEDETLGADSLAIPDNSDRASFAALAAQITAGAGTRYAQALALQEYFRSPENFMYDTSVDPTGDDSVSVFLADRKGYCVQFASAMIMLARSLGIPARLAIGFLAGTPNEDGSSVVRGSDAHAWPEIYFEGAGWVRFEPTPAVQTGDRPSYANSSNESASDEGGQVAAPRPVPSGAPVQGDGTGSQSPPRATTPARSAPWAVIVAASAAVILSLAPAAWWIRRRRAAHDVVASPESVWSGLRALLPADMAWPAALTPRECVDHIDRLLAAEGTELSAKAHEDLNDLAQAVTDFRYAPAGTQAGIEELSGSSRRVAEGVLLARGLDSRGRPLRAGARGGSRHDA